MNRLNHCALMNLAAQNSVKIPKTNIIINSDNFNLLTKSVKSTKH